MDVSPHIRKPYVSSKIRRQISARRRTSHEGKTLRRAPRLRTENGSPDEDLRPLLTVGQVPARIPLSIICVWNAPAVAGPVQPARSLPLDDRVGHSPVLQSARGDLRRG